MVKSAVKEIPEALRLLAQTIERDPRYGPALAWGHAAIFGFARTAGAQIRRRIVERAPISHVYLGDSTLFGGLDVRHRNRDDGAQPLDDPAGLVSCLRNPEQRELYLSRLRLAMGEPA